MNEFSFEISIVQRIIFYHLKLFISNQMIKSVLFILLVDSINIRSSLNDLECLPFLLRVHKSYLVNNYYIKSIKRYQIQLINDVIIPVSQKNYLNIKKQLNLSTHNLI
ncbi:MAG: LytTR family transcriptional regulator DNA-binding domain-containing protein [Thomasclavelia sp.]